MPDKNLKSFMLLVDSLENLADGAKKHSGEEGFPPEITEEKVRTVKLDLETSREKYIQTVTTASQLKEDYDKKEENVANTVSRYKTMLYGYYGKKSKQVQDFGMKPYKEKTSAKNNVAPNANA
jgi:tricorn protease-like protein